MKKYAWYALLVFLVAVAAYGLWNYYNGRG